MWTLNFVEIKERKKFERTRTEQMTTTVKPPHNVHILHSQNYDCVVPSRPYHLNPSGDPPQVVVHYSEGATWMLCHYHTPQHHTPLVCHFGNDNVYMCLSSRLSPSGSPNGNNLATHDKSVQFVNMNIIYSVSNRWCRIKLRNTGITPEVSECETRLLLLPICPVDQNGYLINFFPHVVIPCNFKVSQEYYHHPHYSCNQYTHCRSSYTFLVLAQ